MGRRPRCLEVGGKMFACVGAVMPGVSVKTDSIETAEMLIDAGVGVKAPYFHRSWVNLPWGTSKEELRHRLSAILQAGARRPAQESAGEAGAVWVSGKTAHQRMPCSFALELVIPDDGSAGLGPCVQPQGNSFLR